VLNLITETAAMWDNLADPAMVSAASCYECTLICPTDAMPSNHKPSKCLGAVVAAQERRSQLLKFSII